MRSGVAFRFIGRLSSTGVRCATDINSGNVVCACIDAGIALIDMTSSIISVSNEFKRTEILRHQIYESKLMLDNYVSQCERLAALEIENEVELMEKTLGKIKLELKKSLEYVRLQVDSQKRKLDQDIEFEKKRNRIISDIRLMMFDIIKVSNCSLELLFKDEIKNKFQISALDEQLRIATAQYNKMLKLI